METGMSSQGGGFSSFESQPSAFDTCESKRQLRSRSHTEVWNGGRYPDASVHSTSPRCQLRWCLFLPLSRPGAGSLSSQQHNLRLLGCDTQALPPIHAVTLHMT